MADTKDKDALLHLYQTILPKLAEQSYRNLTEVLPLFDDFRLEKVVDTWTRNQENPSEKEPSLENGNVAQMGLRLQLMGFQRSGIAAFDVVRDLVFKLEHSFYTVGTDGATAWLEKPYYQTWSPTELDEIAQRWCEDVMDAIARQLPQPD